MVAVKKRKWSGECIIEHRLCVRHDWAKKPSHKAMKPVPHNKKLHLGPSVLRNMMLRSTCKILERNIKSRVD